jgi:hypothetical protein
MADRKEYLTRAEVRRGVVYVTREITGISAPYTKWMLLSDNERISLEECELDTICSQCGEKLATEADFAKHFIIPDLRYFNLGYCPVTKKLRLSDKED